MFNDTIAKNIIGIKNIIVKEVKNNANTINILIEMPKKEHICPVCGSLTSLVHDYRVQRAKDIPSFGKM